MFEAPMQDHSDEALMAQIAEGDAAAAEALARRLGPRAFGFAYRLTGVRADAEDIAQEALLRLIRQAPRWQPGRAGPRAWLWRVIANLAHDRGRRLTRQDGLADAQDIVDDRPSAAEQMQQQTRAEALQSALLRLSERQRQAVILRYVEELSIMEAAAVMEISPSALDSLATRGRRALAADLGPRRDALGALS